MSLYIETEIYTYVPLLAEHRVTMRTTHSGHNTL